jgi:GDP-D-mannose 3',5'-epimerase
MTATTILVAGGGGFIGGHLVARLRSEGLRKIRAVDCKPIEEWHQAFPDVDNQVLDLSDRNACRDACRGVTEVYQLAADMGGMGFIETHKADCMLSVLVNTHMLLAARDCGVQRYFFSSSACVYNADKQRDAKVTPLREADAYPALPEDGYGWEKLFSERMCRHFAEDYELTTRVARYHNVYGPFGTWDGGREKAPAAICRKVVHAKATGRHEIEIWGDGKQTRSFLYVDDCVEGTLRLMRGSCAEPLNIGSEELVTIDELVSVVESIAGITLDRRYRHDAPRGVMGRNSDNTRVRAEIGFEPSIDLREGLRRTYAWIEQQYHETKR